MIKRMLAWAGLLIVPALAGCQSMGGVLKPLPAPYHPGRPQQEVASRQPSAPPAAPTPSGRSIRNAVIVIDPGHGGKDPGGWPKATSPMAEKAIVLDISNQVARMLRERGARVVQTRTRDVFISLDERAAIAERNRADLFVSIHADVAANKDAYGAGVHIYNQASVQSVKAARAMVKAFESAGIHCRGIFRNNFHVLREHSRPAMLVECGFMSNAGDARKLNTSSHRTKVAEAIVAGIASQFSS